MTDTRAAGQSTSDFFKHIFELLAWRCNLLASELTCSELLPDKPVQRVGPALPDSIWDCQAPVFKGKPGTLDLLQHHWLQLLLKHYNFLEEGSIELLILLPSTECISTSTCLSFDIKGYVALQGPSL